MEEKEIWMNVLFFMILFLAVYVITYLLNVHKLKKKKNIGELYYLVLKFRLDEQILPIRKMLLWFSLIDAFIISFVTTFITVIDIEVMWQMLIGFVLLFGLIYALYEIYGRHLVNLGFQKKERRK